MAEIRWTEEAADRLGQIHDYISEDNPAAAKEVVLGINEKIQGLLPFPRMGHLYRTEEEGEIRTLLYGHYRIGYLLNQAKDIIILGVYHGSMPIERWLRGKK